MSEKINKIDWAFAFKLLIKDEAEMSIGTIQAPRDQIEVKKFIKLIDKMMKINGKTYYIIGKLWYGLLHMYMYMYSHINTHNNEV